MSSSTIDPCLPNKDFHDAIAASADDKTAILAPADIAHALAAHSAVRNDILGADPLLERPETNAGIVAS
jgi:hypothetical protein